MMKSLRKLITSRAIKASREPDEEEIGEKAKLNERSLFEVWKSY